MLRAVFDDSYSLIALFKMPDAEWQTLLAKWQKASGHPGKPFGEWSFQQTVDHESMLNKLAKEHLDSVSHGYSGAEVFVEWAKTQGVEFLPYDELTQF